MTIKSNGFLANSDCWAPVGDSYILTVAVANFNADPSILYGLKLTVGDLIVTYERLGDWYRGCLLRDRSQIGIFPVSFVAIKELEVVHVGNDEIVQPKEPSVSQEVTTVAREWHEQAKKLFLNAHCNFETVRKMINELVGFRSQVLSATMPVDELKDLTQKITNTIDRGNALLDTDLVLRDENGNILSTANSSIITLYRAQETAIKKVRQMKAIGDRMSLLSVASDDSKSSNHLQVNPSGYALHLSVENFVIHIGDEADLLFALYDGCELVPMTENYVVRWAKEGLVRDVDMLNSLKVVFKDLGRKDLQRDRVLLVCQIIRIGSMELKENNDQSARSSKTSTLSKRSSEEIKRPFGVALVDITDYISECISENLQHECEMSLCMPFMQCGERDSLDAVIKKFAQSKPSDLKNQKNANIGVFIQMILGNSSPQFIDSSLCLSARKMGFPDVIMPVDVRNDLYLTIHSGIFVSKASHAKNIEVTVRVYNSITGKIVPGVIFTGAGCAPLNEYRSVVYRHEERPRWMETIRISIPIDEYFNCHLVFLFKHRSSSESKDKSEKYFALSYAKLKNSDQTAINDNLHELLVYKIEKKSEEEPCYYNYFVLPSTRGELEDAPKRGSILGLAKTSRSLSTSSIQCPGLSLMPKDSFTISTLICSTKLTQNRDLLNFLILQSKTSDDDEVRTGLSKLAAVEGEEIVKFLSDVLDTLFAIFIVKDNESSGKEDIHLSIFDSLVNIICLISDPKYQQFRQVLESYIEHKFSYPLAYIKIISTLQLHIEGLINQCDQQTIRAHNPRNSLCQLFQDDPSLRIMKSLEFLFKFIVRSRKLHSVLQGSNVSDARLKFEQSMRSLFEVFRRFIAIDQEGILKVQAKFLKSFPLAVPNILEVFEANELCTYLIDFISLSPALKLRVQKILYISDIIHIDCLFHRRDCRNILLPVIFPHLTEFISSSFVAHPPTASFSPPPRESLERSTEVLSDALELLFSVDLTTDDISEIMHTVLPDVIKFVCWNRPDRDETHRNRPNRDEPHRNRPDRDDPLAGSLVAIMFEVFRLMKNEHFNNYLAFRDSDTVESIKQLLRLFVKLIEEPVYHKNSSDILLHINSVMLKSLKQIAKFIRARFLLNFEHSLWNDFFHSSITFLTQKPLQLETFSSSKVKKIVSIFGDMRREAAREVRSMWYHLGENKICFVPDIVGPFVKMTLIPDEELRKETIPIFFDMMTCEYASRVPGSPDPIKGNFDNFAHAMIAQLDQLVEGGRGDEEYKHLIYDKLGDLWENHEAREAGLLFVQTVVRQLKRLLEYRRVVSPLCGNSDECMLCIVDILEFYQGIGRQELYLRYLYKLVQLHIECENYVEAGHSLKLHTLLLNWSDDPLPRILRGESYPQLATHRELKEKLYLDIIEYYNKGKLWEDGNRLCKQLVKHYEEVTFDYNRLAELHHKMGQFYTNITKEFRPEPEYFRVLFHGNGFPPFIRNKTYIYRGKEYEQLVSFQTRLLNQYPKASIATKLDQVQDETDSQMILITKVEPLMDDSKRGELPHVVDEKILSYHRVNNIRNFSFSRPLRCDTEKSVNEFAGMSIERTTFSTAYPLPGILRQFQVIHKSVSILSPIENAIETVATANNEVKCLILQQISEETVALNPLTLRLKGIIDAAVNGGIANYERAFFNSSHGEDDTLKMHADKLKNLIADQIPLLEFGLDVHKSKVPDDMKPLHKHLEEQFRPMKSSVEEKYGRRALPAEVIIARERIKKNKAAVEPTLPSSTKGRPGRPGSVFTPNSITSRNGPLHTTLRSFLIAKNNLNATEKRTKSQTQSQTRFYTETSLPMGNSSHQQMMNQHRATSISSLSQSFCIGDSSRNYNGNGDLIPLAETVTTQRPQRPESGRRPTSGTSLRMLSQSHSSIPEIRREASCSSIDSNVSCETISMNPEAHNDINRSVSTNETRQSLKKPPPLPTKFGRISHTDLTTSDVSPRISLTSKARLAPADYKPKPQPRTSKLTEDDVYKNLHSIRPKV